MSRDDLAAVNERLESELARAGARLDGIVACPHEKDACDCRKPGPGMFESAARELDGVEIEGAAMIGDTAIDVEAGRRLGMATVRLGPTGSREPEADYEAEDLLEAVRRLSGLF